MAIKEEKKKNKDNKIAEERHTKKCLPKRSGSS